jgi:hypothetical protein
MDELRQKQRRNDKTRSRQNGGTDSGSLTLYLHADLCRKGYYNEFHGMTGLNANREPEEAAATASSILNQQEIRNTVFQKLQNHTMIQRVQGEKEYE